jgi:O-antigen/teichoic acid export membrane protein
VKQLIHRAAGSTFLRHNLIFFTGSTIVSILNYLYYPVLGRLLQPADFGEVQAIISFFMQAAVFLQVLSLLTIAIIKKYDDFAQRNALTGELERLATIIGITGLALVTLASPWLQQFLQFRSPVPFIILGVAVLIGVPTALSNAYLQGFRRFAALAWSNIVTSSSKLIFSAALVVAGFRTGGAILGLALSAVVGLAYATYLAMKVGRPPISLKWRRPDLTLIRPELRYAGLVFVTSLCINVLLSIDIIAVKHYFSPHVAGLYAGIATIARIIFFLTGPLTAVLISSVKLRDPVHNRALLIRSLGLLLILGGSALLFFTLYPAFVIQLLMGNRYLEFASQLPRLSLAIFILSVSNLLIFYHLMLRRYLVVPAAALGLVTMVILLMLQHQTIPAVVTSLIEGSVLLFILVVVSTSLNLRQGRPAPSPNAH